MNRHLEEPVARSPTTAVTRNLTPRSRKVARQFRSRNKFTPTPFRPTCVERQTSRPANVDAAQVDENKEPRDDNNDERSTANLTKLICARGSSQPVPRASTSSNSMKWSRNHPDISRTSTLVRYRATTSSLSVGHANPYAYTGRRFDDETEIYFYRHRYYHAQLGRFVNRDPLTYRDGANLFAFVGSQPASRTVALGLSSCPCEQIQKHPKEGASGFRLSFVFASKAHQERGTAAPGASIGWAQVLTCVMTRNVTHAYRCKKCNVNTCWLQCDELFSFTTTVNPGEISVLTAESPAIPLPGNGQLPPEISLPGTPVTPPVTIPLSIDYMSAIHRDDMGLAKRACNAKWRQIRGKFKNRRPRKPPMNPTFPTPERFDWCANPPKKDDNIYKLCRGSCLKKKFKHIDRAPAPIPTDGNGHPIID